ncbi:tetratricopeptide repeat protein [Polyangium jinanense]|uniref:Tetratricopeptide repeat protein n=1 Tax=Polyangium jinanense TaxID=2829994 RepID=A0A9X3X3F6_9BACT|nr:hypothetical protein [Polyangium jinanense]MDC3956047.1 hypothetical protein [Polyangium jinanense]MDC3982922.1 hypothetical protein [Polyangium jinanense]
MRISSRKTLFVVFGLLAASSFLAPRAAVSDVAGEITNPSAAAPVLEGMGSLHFPITTSVPSAQRYFNQGMTLAYAFNHAEAERSFLEAARLDPGCAMCFWGAALVLGPNINAPMSDDAVPRAYAHIQRARALATANSVTRRECELIEALAMRYAPAPVADRAPLDVAYAGAMKKVAKRIPDDVDILALYAEALMDLSPWNYWERGKPRANTEEVMSALERAMKLDPNHPGANHYYIHVVESSSHPARALDAAERLADLVPGAGHLVHMPSHIYLRLGRYDDAAIANKRAIVADDRYAPLADPSNMYLVMYRTHNVHFLWAVLALQGKSEEALRVARSIPRRLGHAAHGHGEPMATMVEHFLAAPLYALVRFGRWQEILHAEAPPEDRAYSRGVYHYARAIAFSRLGDVKAADRELAALEKIAAEPSLLRTTVSGVNSPSAVLGVALAVTRGELAADRGDLDTAIRELQFAVVLEDELRYMEPPDWHHPTRQILGAVLLRARRATEAERVYREDLENLPENGFSLFGLAHALELQGKASEAAKVLRRFEVAFARADIRLEASRF